MKFIMSSINFSVNVLGILVSLIKSFWSIEIEYRQYILSVCEFMHFSSDKMLIWQQCFFNVLKMLTFGAFLVVISLALVIH